MTMYDRDRVAYTGGYRPSGAGILTIIAAAIGLGLALLIGLSFIFSNQYEGMRSQQYNQGYNASQPGLATPIPDVRTPDLGNNNDQSAPPSP